MLLPSLATSIANVALPTLAAGFAAPFQDVQWVVLAYLLAITTLTVSAGRMGDVVGGRRLLLTGIVVFATASVLCGVAPTLALLIAARAAQGAGAAVMMALSVALVGDTVPPERTGRAMGLLGTMSALGTTLGPSLGGLVIAGPGWRAAFLVIVPLAVVTASLASSHLPIDRRRPTRPLARVDVVNTLLMTLTLGAYAAAMTTGRGFGPLQAALLGASALSLGLFALVESRASSPLIRWAMFQRPALLAGLAMSALVSSVMIATLVVGPFYLSRALGLSPALVGIVMSAGPLVAALAGIPGGRMVDRRGASPMAIAGLAVMAASCLTLSMIPMALGTLGYVVPIACMTAGYGLFQAANNTAVMHGTRPDERGSVAGLLTLSRNLGLVTGAAAVGAVFVHGSGGSETAAAPPEAVAAGMRMAFTMAAVLALAALAIAIRGTRPSATGNHTEPLLAARGASGAAFAEGDPSRCDAALPPRTARSRVRESRSWAGRSGRLPGPPAL